MDEVTKKNITAFCLASFFNDWCHEMGTAILPMYIIQIVGGAYAPVALGLVQGVSDGASTIMKLFSGLLADKVSYYKPFLTFGYGLTGIFIGLMGTAQSVFVVLICKSMAWMSRGLREPMRDTWISRIVAPPMYGRVFGVQRAFDSIGALIGPLCAFALLKMNYSLSTLFFLAAIPGIMSAVPIMVLTQEKKEGESGSLFVTWKRQLQQLPSQFIYFLCVMLIFGIGNFNQMLVIYRIQELLSLGTDRLSLFATTSGVLLYAFFNIVRSLSEFGIGIMSDYIDRKLVLAFGGFGVFGLTSIMCISSTTSIVFWVFVVACTAFSVGTVKVVEKAYAAELLPNPIRGTGLGMLHAVDGIGDLISSVMVGVLWSWYSPVLGLMYAAILSFTSMVVFLLLK